MVTDVALASGQNVSRETFSNPQRRLAKSARVTYLAGVPEAARVATSPLNGMRATRLTRHSIRFAPAPWFLPGAGAMLLGRSIMLCRHCGRDFKVEPGRLARTRYCSMLCRRPYEEALAARSGMLSEIQDATRALLLSLGVHL